MGILEQGVEELGSIPVDENGYIGVFILGCVLACRLSSIEQTKYQNEVRIRLPLHEVTELLLIPDSRVPLIFQVDPKTIN